MDDSGEETLKPIEEITVGDKVLAYDDETGEQGYKEVVRLFRNETQEWYHVFVGGQEIVCTAEHPFYVVGKGFVPARGLNEGDNLISSNGVQVKIDSLKIEYLEFPETTYNFEVEDFHTYYVSQSKLLAHNKCIIEMQMSRKDAIRYSKNFLGDKYEVVKKGVYKSADGLRTIRFDVTHHPFRGEFYFGNYSPAHLNLYFWKNPVVSKVRNKLLQETVIWLI